MKSILRTVFVVLGILATANAWARSEVRDGNALIEPVKGAKYSIGGAVMGKAELYGYIGDLRDREHLTGLVLKRGGDDEQRHVIGSIARALQLKAFEQDGRDLKPIDLPPNPPAAAPPAAVQPPATPAPAPAQPPAPPPPEPVQH